jgi:hypothetical protein
VYKNITETDMGFTISIKNMKVFENIIYKNIRILETYNSYRVKQKNDFNIPHHTKLWLNKQIYNLK